ncbi:MULTISPECIES: EH signature domain-containing protein [unclassified Shewanella]|uniref:EH signature domain-containing protein n=1 Tax=unclassified Shewanella TaxID=196818 RepID=UPI0035524EA6
MTFRNSRQPWFLDPVLPTKLHLSSSQPPLGGVKEGEQSTVNLDDKDIKSIAKRLKNNEPISEVDWIILLRSEERYQALSATERKSIVTLVWGSLLKDKLRYNKVLIKTVASLARGYHSLADSLVDAFPKKFTASHEGSTQQRTDIVRNLLTQDYLSCAHMIRSSKLSVSKWFEQYELEAEGEHITAICKNAAAILNQSPNTSDLNWWLSCQQSLEIEQTIEQFEQLLLNLNHIESNTDFDMWIQTRCLPDNEETLWYQLSEPAKLKLKSLFHVTSFESVQKIFNALCETSTDPTLTKTHASNLNKRTSFWSSYSDSFDRVRFMLTERSEKLLSNKMDLRQERVTVMTSSILNDASEICIFEIGRYIFIERFRGTNFDLGVFEKSPLLEKLLFESAGLNADIISKLQPTDTADHLHYWQKRLIKFLSNKNIHPNRINSIPKGWFSQLSQDEKLSVDEMKQRRYQHNLDSTSYFKIGQSYR